jgi:hypothetical protein
LGILATGKLWFGGKVGKKATACMLVGFCNCQPHNTNVVKSRMVIFNNGPMARILIIN